MKRACYSTHAVGHYGLAKQDYVHFTSPIRRYADLIVHRVVYQNKKYEGAAIEEAADHISLTERNSSDAEFDSKLIKLLTHLQRQIDSGQPDTYTGMVTEVRNIGAMIDVVGLGIKGLVKRFSMAEDHYRFVPERGRLVGRLRGNEIAPGDTLQVQIDEVDLHKKEADFRIVKTKQSKGKKKAKTQRKTKRNFSPRNKNNNRQPKTKRRKK